MQGHCSHSSLAQPGRVWEVGEAGKEVGSGVQGRNWGAGLQPQGGGDERVRVEGAGDL